MVLKICCCTMLYFRFIKQIHLLDGLQVIGNLLTYNKHMRIDSYVNK